MGDWINDYLAFTEGLPTPPIFRLWSGITAVSGALERRVWIESVQGQMFPNLYTLLVGPPASGKTQAISPVEKLWLDSKKFHVAPNSVTKAALIDAIARSQTNRVLNHGANLLTYHSLLVPASEFGVLLTSHDLEFLSTLNYLFDNPPGYREERRGFKDNPIDIPHPQLVILAGTQPGYLASIMPEEAWTMGFCSRLIMIYAGSSPKVRLFGVKSTTKDHLQKSLVQRMVSMWNLYGGFHIEDPAVEAIETWVEHGMFPVPQHSKLVHYNGRRVINIQKLCMIAAISRCGQLNITLEDFERAREWLLEAESLMPDVFKDMGQKSDAAVIQELHFFMWEQYVKTKNKPLHESLVIHFLSTKMPGEKVLRVMEIATRSGIIAKMGDSLYVPRPKNQHGVE